MQKEDTISYFVATSGKYFLRTVIKRTPEVGYYDSFELEDKEKNTKPLIDALTYSSISSAYIKGDSIIKDGQGNMLLLEYQDLDENSKSILIDLNNGKLIQTDTFKDGITDDYLVPFGEEVSSSEDKIKNADIEGRGLKYYQYINDLYWIVTNSNCFYVLDKDLNKLCDLIEIPEGCDLYITSYGFLLYEPSENESTVTITQYNENGNSICDSKIGE